MSHDPGLQFQGRNVVKLTLHNALLFESRPRVRIDSSPPFSPLVFAVFGESIEIRACACDFAIAQEHFEGLEASTLALQRLSCVSASRDRRVALTLQVASHLIVKDLYQGEVVVDL